MANYRLIYSNLKTGAIQGELPVLSVGIEGAFNEAGSLSASLLLEDTYTMEASDGAGGSVEVTTPQAVSLTSLRAGATGIYLERDGSILWGGVLWAVDMDVASSVATIAASGFMTYLDRLHIDGAGLSYSSTDQGAIAKDLLEKAMAKPGADIGLTAPTPTVSVTRDRAYPSIERKAYGEAIRQLADVQGGFAWRFEHGWAAGETSVDSVMELDVSTLGRETAHVFEVGVNVSLLSLSSDGTELVNYAEAWGQGEGDAGTYRSTYNSDALLSGPLLERIEDFTDIKEPSTLQAKADLAIARGSAPLQRVDLEVFPDSVPKLGAYEIGDRVEVRGQYGGLSLSGLWRILELSLDVAESGLETVNLTLVPQGAFDNV